ncbi:MT-A70-domain-containing protein [Xylariaceae sp. FL0255]|nr:MT-A70-domain-containing protein [Xylariaceae sp. FL0255]
MDSSVLFQSQDGAIVVIDIPRSLEEAQVLPGKPITRRIVSTNPMETPWQVPEPKKDTEQSMSPSAAIAELMTLGTVKSALATVKSSHHGPWCLPRLIEQRDEENAPQNSEIPKEVEKKSHKRKREYAARARDVMPDSPFIPEESHRLLGSIESLSEEFHNTAPLFDLIVLDPPWPSRSARRKRKADGYATVHGIDEARSLLLQIPVASHLKEDGLVAIWVTNKASVLDLLEARDGGILSQWGLEPIGAWTWLKMTTTGEPVFDVDSRWRKPWERLLIARKKGSAVTLPTSSKVILGVPDVHSRKPNLRGLLADVLPAIYLGLEVFARNLTAGWWSWGNEVLLFQQGQCWGPVLEQEQLKLHDE